MPVRSDNPARAAARTRFAHLVDEFDDAPAPAGAVDSDNPPLTDADLARFRPAAEVHPVLVEAKRKGGRPKSSAAKVAVSIRLDPDVLDALRAEGEGWQSRANAMLRKGLGLDATAAKQGGRDRKWPIA